MQYKYAIYSRKSKFTGKGESIENQIELCKDYIRRNYGNTEEKDIIVYEDEGFSGKNTIRPQFQKMMQEAKKKSFTFIICYRLDRISRNIGDFAKLIEELSTLGISFISIREQFDTSSPMGRAMMYIASVFSQLERETIAERIRDNMLELAKTGRWLGGTTPTGYESEKAEFIAMDGRTKKLYQLKVVPPEAELVRLIYRKYMELHSLSKVETYLMLNGYRTKNNKNFTRFTIKGLLSNPVYMIADSQAYQYFEDRGVEVYSPSSDFDGIHGMNIYNRTLQSDGENTITRPIQEWIVCVGKHTGLIEGEHWIKVQELLENNHSMARSNHRSHMAMLSGLLICGNCGNYMRPKSYHCSKVKEFKGYYYLCGLKEKSKGHICNIDNPNGNTLDHLICKELNGLVCRIDMIYSLVSEELIKFPFISTPKEADRLKKQIEEKDKEINQLVRSLTKVVNPVTEEYILKHIEEVRERLEELKLRKSELELAADECSMQKPEIDLDQQAQMIISGGLEELTMEQRKSAIRAVINKVVWDGENIHLYLYPSAPKAQDSK